MKKFEEDLDDCDSPRSHVCIRGTSRNVTIAQVPNLQDSQLVWAIFSSLSLFSRFLFRPLRILSHLIDYLLSEVPGSQISMHEQTDLAELWTIHCTILFFFHRHSREPTPRSRAILDSNWGIRAASSSRRTSCTHGNPEPWLPTRVLPPVRRGTTSTCFDDSSFRFVLRCNGDGNALLTSNIFKNNVIIRIRFVAFRFLHTESFLKLIDWSDAFCSPHYNFVIEFENIFGLKGCPFKWHFSSNVCSDAHFSPFFFKWEGNELKSFDERRTPSTFSYLWCSLSRKARLLWILGSRCIAFRFFFKEMKEIAKRRFNSTWSTQAKCTWFSPYMTWANIDAGWFHVPRFLTRTAQLALDRTSIANIFAELWLLLR